MDSDIQFGEIEEAGPERQLRPDKNRHYAVVAWGEPEDEDLPIFVDLDVMHDMETHAQSDTSVELGGVLLGGQYEDENGRPFVVVTDSLRANHFEATKGSFKFTHDTWSQISREREEYPPELQMVGWYHTHPDWGVFLSGMDMFICDNFFNKKLDIALVIDPCRGDRGMFMWTGNPRQRVRRTGGFQLIASRYRRAELEQYVSSLQGNEPMPGNLPTGGGYGAPVIHVTGDKQPPWMPIAVLGMLSLQFCLVALIAWKLLAPTDVSDKDKLLKELLAERGTKAREEVQREVLKDLAADIRGVGAENYTTSLQKRNAELREANEKLAHIERDKKNLNRDLGQIEDNLKETESKLKAEVADAKKLREEQKKTDEKHKEELTSLNAKIKALDPDAKVDEKTDGTASRTQMMWIVGGTIGALALFAGGLMLWQQNKPPEEEAEHDADREPRTRAKPAAPAVDAVLETPEKDTAE